MTRAAFVVAILALGIAACAGRPAEADWPGGGHPSGDGRLKPEVIQRIVRDAFPRMRDCYESAMRKNPNLRGRVTTRFLIDREGAVAMIADGGTELPDDAALGVSGVAQCVRREFGNLRFPSPDGGEVVVVYPIMFAPGD
jgi:hypothetical protein